MAHCDYMMSEVVSTPAGVTLRTSPEPECALKSGEAHSFFDDDEDDEQSDEFE